MQVIVPLALMAGSYFVMKNKRYGQELQRT